MCQYTVAIVEDDEDTLSYINQTLSKLPELNIIGTAKNFVAAEQFLTNHSPDILLTDLGLPDGSGIDLIRMVCNANPQSLVMVLSAFGDEKSVIAAIMAGAKGYLLKNDDHQGINQGIRQLIEGGSPISAAIARYLLVQLRGEKKQSTLQKLGLLTARETQVLELISLGYRNNEIAEKLSISYYTVVNHVRHVYDKLAVSSRSQAVYKASQIGLLKPLSTD